VLCDCTISCETGKKKIQPVGAHMQHARAFASVCGWVCAVVFLRVARACVCVGMWVLICVCVRAWAKPTELLLESDLALVPPAPACGVLFHVLLALLSGLSASPPAQPSLQFFYRSSGYPSVEGPEPDTGSSCGRYGCQDESHLDKQVLE